MEKYENEKGQIGVIVSGGFGAGWSTWNGNSDFLAMDRTIVEMKLNGESEKTIGEYIEMTNGDCPYTGGWDDAHVEWVNKGVAFTITEYDGNESLRTSDDFNFLA